MLVEETAGCPQEHELLSAAALFYYNMAIWPDKGSESDIDESFGRDSKRIYGEAGDVRRMPLDSWREVGATKVQRNY